MSYQGDAAYHQPGRDHAAQRSDGHVVAVSDRGDYDDCPPQGVPERCNGGVGGGPLGVEHCQEET